MIMEELDVYPVEYGLRLRRETVGILLLKDHLRHYDLMSATLIFSAIVVTDFSTVTHTITTLVWSKSMVKM